MPGMDDYHAYKSTCSDGEGGSGGPGRGNGWLWILGILAIVYLISEVFG